MEGSGTGMFLWSALNRSIERLAHNDFLILVEKLLDIYAKHRTQLAQDQQGRIADRTLDPADIGPINVGAKCQFFLRQLSLIPKRTDVLRQNFPGVVEAPCHEGTLPLARPSIHGIYSTMNGAPSASLVEHRLMETP